MAILHPLDLSKSVLDPIHGLVRMTKEEIGVINHPLFQRLRKVKQNGLLHLIFPSATHTRFEHSIGVLFVADSILRALVFNSIASLGESKNRIVPLKEAGQGQAFNFNDLDPKVLEEIFRVTRLAALVHDLGHGPLSHTFDKFAPLRTNVLDLFDKDESLEKFSEFREIFQKYDGNHANIPHEVMSCLFFLRIWNEINKNDFWVAQAVTAAILGGNAIKVPSLESRAKWLPLVHDLVASAPADADRMDYLERDSRSAGVTYGLFDRNRLLKSMLVYMSDEGNYRLGIKLSGYRSVENFIQARFELFVQIYYHKTNRAIELMLSDIRKKAEEEGSASIVGSASLAELEEGYKRLSDENFIDRLCDMAGGIAKTAKRIRDRQLWKRVFDLQDYGGGELEKVVELCRELNIEYKGCEFQVDGVNPAAVKGLDEGARMLTLSSSEIYTVDPAKKWTNFSPIIKTLSDNEKTVARIFVEEPKGEIKVYRAAARKIWMGISP